MLLFPLKDGQQDATECLVSINMVTMVSSGEACCFKLYTGFKYKIFYFYIKYIKPLRFLQYSYSAQSNTRKYCLNFIVICAVNLISTSSVGDQDYRYSVIF